MDLKEKERFCPKKGRQLPGKFVYFFASFFKLRKTSSGGVENL